MKSLNRRKLLQGVVGGSAVTVGLPLLNCFLNGNGTAMADGKAMPVRFGTWVWGLGVNRSVFNPKKVGTNYDLPEEIACLEPVRNRINVFSDYIAYRDASPNMCHYTAWVITRSGQCPETREDRPGETIDVTMANEIGRSTRYKMLNATATGDVRTTQSYEGQTSVIPSEFSPVDFYARLFGADFQNPNASAFTPNPRIMLRRSAISGVMDDVKDLNTYVGAEDKARLEQYLSGLRDLERQMDQQLTKPEPRAACQPAAAPARDPMAGVEATTLAKRHDMMTDLMLMALACDQTRVFNMVYASGGAVTVKTGYEKPHHTCTHEEIMDEKLGYQVNASWFARRAMESWLYFVQASDKIKEGDGTLLDNMLVMAHSEQGFARIHSLDGMGMFTAGRAGGKVKSGYHFSGKNTAPVTELGYTAMRVLGLDLPQWGTKSNATSKVISEILA